MVDMCPKWSCNKRFRKVWVVYYVVQYKRECWPNTFVLDICSGSGALVGAYVYVMCCTPFFLIAILKSLKNKEDDTPLVIEFHW